MTETSPGFFHSRRRGTWIRLRTLILLRWWAVIGQMTALIIAQRIYDLDFETGLCFLVIGASIISNLVASTVFPENKG